MTTKRRTPQPLHGLKAPHSETSLAPSLPSEPSDGKIGPLEEQAIAYVRRGWALLPLYPKSKLPYVELLPRDRKGDPSWKLLAAEPATDAEVRGWFRKDPNCNIGIITGAPSGGLVVGDVDQPDKAKGLHLPPTACVGTARGSHYFYISTQPVATQKTSWGEIRGEGAYVVAAPSLHPSGIQYQWSDFCAPGEIDLAELPQDLLDAVVRERSEAVASLRHRGSKTNTCLAHPPADPVAPVVDLVEWACREDAAFALMRLCGAEVQKIGAGFRCPLPGHGEHKPSAALWRQADGTIGFHDFHMKSGPAWFSLAEVFASCKAGRVMKLGPGEKAAWLLRGLVEARLMAAPRILAPRLPANVKPAVKAVFEGFKLLLAVRALYNPEQEAAPFSWRFASAWCGKGERHVGEAVQWLLAQGYLRTAKAADGGTGKWTAALFAMGTPKEM